MLTFKISVVWPSSKLEHVDCEFVPNRHLNSYELVARERCLGGENWIEFAHGSGAKGNRGIYPGANCKQILRILDGNEILKEWKLDEHPGEKRLLKLLNEFNSWAHHYMDVLVPLGELNG